MTTERTLAQQAREFQAFSGHPWTEEVGELMADFARSIVEEEVRILIEWFKEWRPCDCGADDGKKYNTECGHAINCDMYAAHELARSMRTRHGLTQKG